MRYLLSAIAFFLLTSNINDVLAESGVGEILQVKQNSTGGPTPNRNGSLIVQLDNYSGSDNQCNAAGRTTLILESERAQYEQMMQIALSALLSGRRIAAWFTVNAQSCSLYAIAIQR